MSEMPKSLENTGFLPFDGKPHADDPYAVNQVQLTTNINKQTNKITNKDNAPTFDSVSMNMT